LQAPLSLAKTLQDYIDAPDFETARKNRLAEKERKQQQTSKEKSAGGHEPLRRGSQATSNNNAALIDVFGPQPVSQPPFNRQPPGTQNNSAFDPFGNLASGGASAQQQVVTRDAFQQQPRFQAPPQNNDFFGQLNAIQAGDSFGGATNGMGTISRQQSAAWTQQAVVSQPGHANDLFGTVNQQQMTANFQAASFQQQNFQHQQFQPASDPFSSMVPARQQNVFQQSQPAMISTPQQMQQPTNPMGSFANYSQPVISGQQPRQIPTNQPYLSPAGSVSQPMLPSQMGNGQQLQQQQLFGNFLAPPTTGAGSIPQKTPQYDAFGFLDNSVKSLPANSGYSQGQVIFWYFRLMTAAQVSKIDRRINQRINLFEDCFLIHLP
jgi:hypothetical protein